jgi:hypothetical protein
MVKLLLPDPIVQEIRNLAAVVCCEIIFTRKAEGATTTVQIELMEKTFHGSPGYALVLDELLYRKGDFQHLYMVLPLENNCEGNKLHRQGQMLELKEIYHRRLGERFIVQECDFVREVLADHRELPLKGRNIDDRAQDFALNYKHAPRFYKEYAQTSAAGDNWSGMKFEDTANFVLRKMFVHCKGKTSRYNATSKEEFNKTEDNLPSKWFFTGYFAFFSIWSQPTIW